MIKHHRFTPMVTGVICHNLLFAVFLSVCIVSFPVNARTESFKILGGRPLALGGAFVAVAEDSLAQYWNPAGIATQKKFDMEIPIGVKAEFTGGILKDVNTIGELAGKFAKVQTAQQNGTSIDVDQLSSIIQTVSTLKGLNSPDKGVLIEVQGGLNIRIMRMAFSINNFTSAGGVPFIDTENLGFGSAAGLAGLQFTDGITVSNDDKSAPPRLIAERDKLQTSISDLRPILTQAGITIDASISDQELANALINQAIDSGVSDADISSAVDTIESNRETAKDVLGNIASGSPYTNNSSNVTLRGISLLEAAIGYSHRFFFDDLYLGGNLKILAARVGYFKEEFLKEKVEGKDISADFNKNTKQSIQPGIDLGLMYDKRLKWRTKFGIVARNVNFPKFEQPDAAGDEPKYRVEPQVRAGIALYPFKRKFWVISSDLDLTTISLPCPDSPQKCGGWGRKSI